MADLIDRAALLERIDAKFFATNPSGEEQLGYLGSRTIIRTAPAVDAVPVVKRTEEIERAISVLNVYRNAYYKEPSGTVKYAVADAINTILPLVAKCLERRTNATDRC